MFIRLLARTVNASNHTKCASLSTQKCTTKPTLINYILMNILKDYVIVHLQLI